MGRTGSRGGMVAAAARARVTTALVLAFLIAAPAFPGDDRQLVRPGTSPDVLIILDSSLSMNHDFTDAFDLPAYMDDFIYPQGTSANTNGSKLGVAKSVLRQVLSSTPNVNFAFSYYRNPNPRYGPESV